MAKATVTAMATRVGMALVTVYDAARRTENAMETLLRSLRRYMVNR